MYISAINRAPNLPIAQGIAVISVLGDSLSSAYTRRTPLWFDLLTILSGGSVMMARNKETAASGFNTGNLFNSALTDLLANWLSERCTVRIICIGTNDMPNGPWSGDELTQFAGRYRAIVGAALMKPEPVIIVNIAPKSGAAGTLLSIEQANEEIRKIAIDFGVTYVDIYSRFVGTLADYLEINDTTHWNAKGAMVVAQAVLEGIKRIRPVGSTPPMSGSYGFSGTNANRGLLFHADTGASWGYGGSASATTSLTTNAAVYGKVNKAVVSGNGGYWTLDSGQVNSGFTGGDWILATVKVRCYGATGGNATKIPGFRMRIGNGAYSVEIDSLCPATYDRSVGGDTGFVQLALLNKLSNNASFVQMFLNAELMGSGSDTTWGLTYELGEAFVWNVTNRNMWSG